MLMAKFYVLQLLDVKPVMQRQDAANAYFR
jgi:hypothetical protein